MKITHRHASEKGFAANRHKSFRQLVELPESEAPPERASPFGMAIYALEDPLDGTVRYIGATWNPERRLREHCAGAQRSERMRLWIRGLVNRGLKPEMRILDRVPHELWERAERQWIAYVRNHARIYNWHVGGQFLGPGFDPLQLGKRGARSGRTSYIDSLGIVRRGKRAEPKTLAEPARRRYDSPHGPATLLGQPEQADD